MSAEGESIFEESVQTTDVVEATPANDNKLLLKANYAYVRICKSFPLADIGDCNMTPEEALWWAFEHSVEKIDTKLEFRDNLPVEAEHLAILKTHWRKLEIAQARWQMITRTTWKNHLDEAPQRGDEDQVKIDGILERAKINDISQDQRRMISAIIPLNSDSQDFTEWRNKERSFRESGYLAFSEYIRGLRAYYELLIQSLKASPQSNSVKNPLKQKVAIANRIARIVDAGFFAMMGARSITHEQSTPPGKPDSRIRASGKAFIDHPHASMMRTGADTLPFYINSPQLPRFSEIIAHIIALALHDIPEDSHYDEATALKTIMGLLHHVDSSITQHITHSPNNTPIRDFIDQTLSLMTGRNDINIVLTPILRALNKNYKLSEDEIEAASFRNAAGPKTTSILSRISEDSAQGRQVTLNIADSTLQLFDEFPDSVEPKIDAFIVKLLAIADGAAKRSKSEEHDATGSQKFVPKGEDLSTIILWTTLTVKMGERCHNTDEMREGNPGYALRTVRANSTRLIPFALEILAEKQEKFGDKNFSFYNVLPRLICSTLREYEKLNGSALTAADQTNIENLKKWSAEYPIISIDAYLEDPNTPDVVRQDMKRYREKIAGVMAADALA